jgi:TRAP-type mannitol/chloroaromatic compound transport system permease small subunit
MIPGRWQVLFSTERRKFWRDTASLVLVFALGIPAYATRPFLSRIIPDYRPLVVACVYLVLAGAAVIYLSLRYPRSIIAVIDTIVRAAGVIAMWCCLVLVLLTVEQVIARYAFNSSSVGLQELEWHLFGVIFLLAGAYAQRSEAHVRVDIFYGQFSAKTQAWINVLGILFCMIPTCGLITWFGIDFAQQALRFTNPNAADHVALTLAPVGSMLYSVLAPIEAFLRRFLLVGEISPDPGGLEARWIIRAAIPLGAGLLTLQAVPMMIQNVRILAGLPPLAAGKGNGS